MADVNFNGSVVLISGGGTGIGRGMALAFARANAKVAICGRRIEPLNEVVSEMLKLGGQSVALKADVTTPADCQRVVAETTAKFGGLNILVNNAGIARYGPLTETADADIDQMLSINVAGAALLSKYAIPALALNKDKGGASILNIASSVANKPLKDFAVYSATKAAVVHFTKCLASELAPQKIRVNCINPGVVETPIFGTMMPKDAVDQAMENYAKLTPLGRVGQPEDIARAAIFLSAPEAEWITGAVMTVDGGVALT